MKYTIYNIRLKENKLNSAFLFSWLFYQQTLMKQQHTHWNTYAQWTHSACCSCDLRFPNIQQVTVNTIASPVSTTTRRPITPPKEAIGQLPTILLEGCSTSLVALDAIVHSWSTSRVTKFFSRHITPNSMSQSLVAVQLTFLLSDTAHSSCDDAYGSSIVITATVKLTCSTC